MRSMDDRALNPLRLALLVAIAAYFAWAGLHQPATVSNSVSAPPQALSAPSHSPQPAATSSRLPATPVGPAATPSDCGAHILEVGSSTHEVRLKVDGVASRILVYTAAGPVTASTETAGSAGAYRVLLPAPAQAVQLDDCPALNLP